MEVTKSDRQRRLLEIISARRFETIPNLAYELGVSRYTIMRDYLDRAGFLYADKRIKFVRPSNIMKVYPLIDRCFANQWFHWDDNPVLRWSCNNTKLVRARKSTVTESGDNDIGNFLFGKIEPETRKTDPFMALVASMCFEEDLTDMKIIQEREFIPVFTF